MQLTVLRQTSLVSALRPGLPRRRRRQIDGVCQAFKTSRRGASPQRSHECLYVEVKPDGSDAWRLEPVANLLKNGAVGIIPTDSYPAFVCDLGSPEATLTLAKIKDVSPKKPMSILCRNFRDVDTYTMGWPVSTIAGLPDAFRLVKEIVPGCYTFILPASKNLPKVVTNPSKHRVKQRHTVGVRLPDSAVCQELLRLCDRPLLCTSVHVSELDRFEVADAATMMDEYAADINFIVDVGPFVAYPSTVVDMTGAVPEVLRIGKGDPSPFDPYHIL